MDLAAELEEVLVIPQDFFLGILEGIASLPLQVGIDRYRLRGLFHQWRLQRDGCLAGGRLENIVHNVVGLGTLDGPIALKVTIGHVRDS